MVTNMTNSLSRNAQLVALGEGLALGAIMHGIDSIGWNKGDLELRFRAAWRAWTHRSHLPAIDAGPTRDDVLIQAVDRSARRRGPIVAEWVDRAPRLRHEDWSHVEVAESIHDGIPAQAWADLVAMWLGPEQTRAAGDGSGSSS